MSMQSVYLRLRQKTGQYVPFAPPLASPKNTEPLTFRQKAHYVLWRFLMVAYPPTVGRWHVTKRPLFLMGCHNSGTTILARLIGQHPAMVNWSEAPEVWTPDDLFLNWSILDKPSQTVPFLFDPMAYELKVSERHADIPQIRDVFSLFALSRGRRLLNKNPHMSISIPFMEATFPDAGYIHIRRNGYAVVQSLLSNWRVALTASENPQSEWHMLKQVLDPIYYDDPLALVRLCARYWELMDAKAVEDLQALHDAQRVYYTTYEEICANPEQVLREVFAQFDLNPQRYNWRQLHNPTRYPWKDMLPMENRNFKYRERMTREEINAVTAEVGEALATYGYAEA